MKRKYTVKRDGYEPIEVICDCMKYTDDELIFMDYNDASSSFIHVSWFDKTFVSSVTSEEVEA